MDAVTAWLKDRKNLPFVAIGAGTVLILVVFLLLKMTGVIGGTTADAPGMTPGVGMPTSGSPGMPTLPGARTTSGAPSMPGMGVPSMPGARATTNTVTSSSIKPLAPREQSRPDPFKPFVSKKKGSVQGSNKNADEKLVDMLPGIGGGRVLPPAPVTGYGPGPVTQVEETLPPQPTRRMAGVMMNGKVSAILETNGDTDVVVVGQVVTRGNSRVRVESISQDQIVLKTLDTNKPFTINVTLKGSEVVSPRGTGRTAPGAVPPPGVMPPGIPMPTPPITPEGD